ncbi:Hypothetical protein FKW44_009608 [Caligus rogercresseyi]|uniref:Uncharacterized protein n=1 Tax=Caligus rogercresseyi TaxID=217165 RepID=A0A7T8HGI6_CALRO|nr:Hypothetical protein FKW44_009608 [Caligus rogercresseyi]
MLNSKSCFDQNWDLPIGSEEWRRVNWTEAAEEEEEYEESAGNSTTVAPAAIITVDGKMMGQVHNYLKQKVHN